MTLSASAARRGQTPPRISVSLDSPELAAAYDRFGMLQFDHGKQLVALLQIARGESVLDIGAGTGRLAAYVAAIVGESGRVVAIDPLPLRVDITRARAARQFEAMIGRAEDLSAFSDGSFDAVYLNSVYHWVEDKPCALDEIYRLLRPGGRLGVNCHDPDRPHDVRLLVRQAMIAAKVELAPELGYPSLGISAAELTEQITAAGFIDVLSEQRTFVDIFPDLEAVLGWASSSTFGNFLNGMSNADRGRFVKVLGRLLEVKRGQDGIRLERYLNFATARKPVQFLE
jgi:ubiquinone/menaquinone biosynthesis C-methylase UbiE